MPETITIPQAVEKSGLTTKQIRARIKSGEIEAVKDMSGGKQGVWRINPDSIKPEESKEETTVNGKSLREIDIEYKTAQIKKIEQQLEAGRNRIRKDLLDECIEEALDVLNQASRLIKSKAMNCTKKQQKVWNAFIDKIEKDHSA